MVEQARVAALQLTGEGGLLQQLTKRVIEAALDEAALDGEITDHLSVEKYNLAGRRKPALKAFNHGGGMSGKYRQHNPAAAIVNASRSSHGGAASQAQPNTTRPATAR